MKIHHHLFLSFLTAICFLLAQAFIEYSLLCLLALNFEPVMIWFGDAENVSLVIEVSLMFSIFLVLFSGWFAGKYGKIK